MKKIFTLVFIIVVNAVFAQPVIQYTNMPNPSAGITATILIGPKPVSPGPSGAGVTWNFSSISFTAAGTASIVVPASTPYGASFPNATMAAIVALPTGTVYTYDNVQPTFKDQLGDAITATGGATYTPDPKRHLVFPFNYGNSYTDSYQCVSCSPSSFTISYDAYGTLIVNGKTYNNVARVTNMFGNPYYNYYSTNPVYSIFAYDASPSSSPYATLVEIAGVGVSVTENYVTENVKVFPNPANDVFTISNQSFMKINFALIDVLGKEVRPMEELIQGGNTQVDISTFPSGLYFIKYHDEFGNDSYGKLIVE
ncbi:MAG: T9SS type A sorting domain-containing protein [Bacteroidetes bacterium]|nr:T9SS type A sorting domain-containing protein [Bacteroidota bacterium]